MTKEQLALKIAREIYKGKGKLESFHAFQCIRSYFFDLSMDDLEVFDGQYGINIEQVKSTPETTSVSRINTTTTQKRINRLKT